MSELAATLDAWLQGVGGRLRQLDLTPQPQELGRVLSLADGVALVSGLPSVRLNELLLFEEGAVGLAVQLDRNQVGCVLLGPQQGVLAGSRLRGTQAVVEVPVGEALLGRTVDPLGQPLDERGPIDTAHRARIERPAPPLVDREPVTQPLLTGLTAIDAMLPLGRGQRELIIGDHYTGKSAIAIDTIINQRHSDVICIYAAIGQKSSSVAAALRAIFAHGPKERCIAVVAPADAAAGLQWVAPYAACAMAEYFMDRGRHVLLVLDDLTKHALVHRQIALLLRQPPGREAYPGDIFYLHSRLLERAAKLNSACGGGSLTVLPIAETQAGNLAAYIPTNLISITDGQIVLEPRLFNEQVKPAIDLSKSVSRIGGKTQLPAMRAASERLRLDYAQFLELEVFTRFGGGVDQRSQQAIVRGRRVRAALVQPQLQPLLAAEQVALLLALAEGLLDAIPESQVAAFRDRLRQLLPAHCPEIMAHIAAGAALTEDERATLLQLAREPHAGA